MQRALDLSLKGSGFVNPNPLVGAVIVKNNRIIGEGYHEYFGGAHAELNAIQNVRGNAVDATLYVTLEPCNHHGKTPPCTERIIQEKFRKVVIGIKDPNPNVTGNGISRLKEEGIEVVVGVLEQQIQYSNEVFLKYTSNKIPFCILKMAMTMDGKIATHTGDSKWITNEKSRKWSHELRHQYSAIMVGVNTVIHDDPELTDRSDHLQKKNPLRIVVDSTGRIPMESKILDTSHADTVVALTKNATKETIQKINKKGVRVIVCPENNGKVELLYLFKALGNMNIDSVLIEGGGQLNFSALEEGLVDKVYSFVAPKIIGGHNAITPIEGKGFAKIDDAITLKFHQIRNFENDILIEAYINSQ